jgi:hypothetical protein
MIIVFDIVVIFWIENKNDYIRRACIATSKTKSSNQNFAAWETNKNPLLPLLMRQLMIQIRHPTNHD